MWDCLSLPLIHTVYLSKSTVYLSKSAQSPCPNPVPDVRLSDWTSLDKFSHADFNSVTKSILYQWQQLVTVRRSPGKTVTRECLPFQGACSYLNNWSVLWITAGLLLFLSINKCIKPKMYLCVCVCVCVAIVDGQSGLLFCLCHNLLYATNLCNKGVLSF